MNDADHFENEFIADALLDSVTFEREKLVEIINKCTKVASDNSCDAAFKVCCLKSTLSTIFMIEFRFTVVRVLCSRISRPDEGKIIQRSTISTFRVTIKALQCSNKNIFSFGFFLSKTVLSPRINLAAIVVILSQTGFCKNPQSMFNFQSGNIEISVTNMNFIKFFLALSIFCYVNASVSSK